MGAAAQVHGLGWGGEGPILADIQCSFIKQLQYPAEIEVYTRIARLGGKSTTLEAAIFEQGSETAAAPAE